MLNSIQLVLLSLLSITKSINCLNITRFSIENGSISNKPGVNNESIYEVKCNLGYSLNSNSALITYDFEENKWRPNSDYLIQSLPLCAKICKLRTNGILVEEKNEIPILMKTDLKNDLTSILILNENTKLNLKCKRNDSVIRIASSSSLDLTCNSELRRLTTIQQDFLDYKCTSTCNVNYLLDLIKTQKADIGKFYPLNPKNPFYSTKESIRLYCNSENTFFDEFDRKVVLFECGENSNWYLSAKNELVSSVDQMISECLLTQDQAKNVKFSNLDFYFKKNFKNLLNLKLNLKLFLIILLISSLLIIIFLIFLLIVTFYKRYRMNNYYRCFITRSDTAEQRAGGNRRGRSFFNNLFRRRRRNNTLENNQRQQIVQSREDQLTFSIGSSSSLNHQNTQNVNLPTYDEAINKPMQQQQQQQSAIATTTTTATPPSPPPSFSAISKEAYNQNSTNLQSRNNNDNIDSQSNYSSISAASALIAANQNSRRAKKLRFNRSTCSQSSKTTSYQYYQPNHQQQQQHFFDSNETFSLNSAAYCINSVNTCGTASIAANSALGGAPSEICTIITNSSLNSAESNASKFVLTGSIENNIDQTSLFNYSTSASDAILHNEVEPLLANQSHDSGDTSNNNINDNQVQSSNSNIIEN